MAKKAKEIEVQPDGIWVSLGGPYWIKFVKVWTFADEAKFAAPQLSNLDAFRLIVEKTVDWHLPDGDWNDWPFEKERLLKHLEAFKQGQQVVVLQPETDEESAVTEPVQVPSFPAQLERPLLVAWWRALGEAKNLPLVSK